MYVYLCVCVYIYIYIYRDMPYVSTPHPVVIRPYLKFCEAPASPRVPMLFASRSRDRPSELHK